MFQEVSQNFLYSFDGTGPPHSFLLAGDSVNNSEHVDRQLILDLFQELFQITNLKGNPEVMI
jgi:hypothetical protein